MGNIYKNIFSRNIGLFSENEQEKIKNTSIAIAGVGGIGGLLAERLIRLGINKLTFIDPGLFEDSNSNRQFGSNDINIGKNKAEEVFNQIKNINPTAEIKYLNKGIRSQKDADEFLTGCDIVADEMDFGLFKESIFLQRAARKKNAYYLFTSAIGFGALITIFDPNGISLEEYNSLPKECDLEKIDQPSIALERICPYQPSYMNGKEDIVEKIIKGEIAIPTNSVGVGFASILTANEIMNTILKKREIPLAPKYIFIDLLDQKIIKGEM